MTPMAPMAPRPFICISLSALDILIEYPPYVDRVYSHIIRRAGYDGTCWESVTNMAKFLRISLGSTKKALQLLGDHGLITRESRVGTTSLYRITRDLGHNTGGVDQNIHPNLGHYNVEGESL